MFDIELKEQVGVALNPRSQTADSVGDVAMKIGALAKVDELGALLVRMKYGDDKRRSCWHRAVLLLAKRERSSTRFKRVKYSAFKREVRDPRVKEPRAPMSDVVERFSAAVLDAWLDDQCGACTGRGTVSQRATSDLRSVPCPACNATGRVTVECDSTVFCRWPFGMERENLVKAGRNYLPPADGEIHGEMLRRSRSDVCSACNGFGRNSERVEAVSKTVCAVCQGKGKRWQVPAQRAHAMGVNLGQYVEFWHDRFETSLRMLSALDEWTNLQLRRQLGDKMLAVGK
ncbi:hypothetical protein [Caballeronia sp. LjRoot31]|uniref:hypothetical protein n=1 Tax=Caballeronia sp. LjRoot31 TaxID=3342324 RepID=UPI003ED11410